MAMPALEMGLERLADSVMSGRSEQGIVEAPLARESLRVDLITILEQGHAIFMKHVRTSKCHHHMQFEEGILGEPDLFDKLADKLRQAKERLCKQLEESKSKRTNDEYASSNTLGTDSAAELLKTEMAEIEAPDTAGQETKEDTGSQVNPLHNVVVSQTFRYHCPVCCSSCAPKAHL